MRHVLSVRSPGVGWDGIVAVRRESIWAVREAGMAALRWVPGAAQAAVASAPTRRALAAGDCSCRRSFAATGETPARHPRTASVCVDAKMEP